MGEVEPDAPTEFAGFDKTDTEIAHAWALDYEDEAPTERLLTPRRITSAAVVLSVAAVVAAGVVGILVTRDPGTAPASAPPVPSPTSATPRASQVAAPSPLPPPRPLPPAVVTLPSGQGIVYVGTKSGKTACQLTAGTVACLVQFVVSTPIRYGTHANMASVSAVGDFDWGIGDTGQQEYPPLQYGTTYKTLGWTITPTTDGTTFLNDATAHGMTVSIEGVVPF